jgi:hypothetical protein
MIGSIDLNPICSLLEIITLNPIGRSKVVSKNIPGVTPAMHICLSVESYPQKSMRLFKLNQTNLNIFPISNLY